MSSKLNAMINLIVAEAEWFPTKFSTYLQESNDDDCDDDKDDDGDGNGDGDGDGDDDGVGDDDNNGDNDGDLTTTTVCC